MRLVTLTLLLTLWSGSGAAEVVMVFGVQRHAARNVLPKSANLTESDATGGPTLLPQGVQQAYAAGSAFQLRYLNQTACSSTCLPGANSTVDPRYGLVNTTQGIFNAYNTLVRSSGLDRTISTARAFLSGAFPAAPSIAAATGLPDGQQVVPVYSLGEDPLIRAYTQCPAYVDKLQAWYASSAFAAKAAESNTTRAAVGVVAPTLNVSLANWYNVWDGFLVNREYGVGNPMPPIDNTTFADMQDLAYWLETSKMASDLTSNLLGGLLLGNIVTNLRSAQANYSSGSVYDRLLLVSSHYNVQLGLLSALALDKSPAAGSIAWLSKLPEFASIMVFELHASAAQPQSFAVRLVMQDGPAADYQTIPLPCATSGDAAEALAGPGACSFDAFLAVATPASFAATEQWCTACNNTVYPACKVAALQSTLAATQGCSSGNAKAWQLALAALLPALAVAALAALAFIVYRKRQQRVGAESKPGLRSQHLGDSAGDQEWSA